MNAMSDELLRGALADAASTVTPQSLRPLPTTVRRRSRWIAMTAISAAVAAALAITVVTVVHRSRTPAPGPLSLAAYVGLRYTVEGGGPPGTAVMVYDAVTRKQLAVVAPPKGTAGFWDVARTADDRLYVLTTFDRPSATVHFYRLHLGSGGVPDGLSELTRAALQGQPGGTAGPETLAVTPDGTKLAYVTESGATVRYENGGYEITGDEHVREHITLIDLRTWTRRVIGLPKATSASMLMWAADGRHLFFGQTPLIQRSGDQARDGLYVTDTEGAAVRAVKLGLPGTDFVWDFPATEGADIVALTNKDGRYGLIWYSLANDAITHQADLGPGNVVGTDSIGTGDRIALSIGDYIYTVHGTTVQKHARSIPSTGPTPTP